MSWAGLVRVALIRALHLELGCGVREAVALSEALLRAPDGVLPLGGRLSLTVNRLALEDELRSRLAETLESAPRPRRGRPPRRSLGPAA